jgi:hypothetical protein
MPTPPTGGPSVPVGAPHQPGQNPLDVVAWRHQRHDVVLVHVVNGGSGMRQTWGPLRGCCLATVRSALLGNRQSGASSRVAEAVRRG